MPKVKFLVDFQGVETRNIFYKAGQIAEVDDSISSRVIADGRAVLAAEPAPAGKKGKHYGAQAEPELRHDDEIAARQHSENEPQFEDANEPPKPKAKGGKRQAGPQ